MDPFRRIVIGTVLLAAATPAWLLSQGPAVPRITTAIPWAGRGVWLKADLHLHSRFSDGRHTVDELVAAAARNGCDVVAIADHADVNLKAATPEYVAAIGAARAKAPTVTVITALEWNLPPGKGTEHATVLFPSALEGTETLTTFKERFDDYHRTSDRTTLVRDARDWLQQPAAPIKPVVIVNHPSRVADSPSAPSATFEALARQAPGTFVGIEGAPGHQRMTPLGAYKGPPPVDRWDRLVANVGDGWDSWLARGLNVWAALANSDFHGENDDFWPCEFARTWIYAPDRTIDGVIRAVRAGSFFAEHGHIVDNVQLYAAIEGLPRRITPGEVALARSGAQITLSVEVHAADRDYRQRENRIDAIELIGISAQGARILSSTPLPPSSIVSTTVSLPASGMVFRARGRRLVDGGPALMFHTNPIRVTTSTR